MNRSVIVLGVALAGFTACSSEEHKESSVLGDASPRSPYPDCNAIAEACHPVDMGDPGEIHDCHEEAHGAKSNADCTPIKARCVEICGQNTHGG